MSTFFKPRLWVFLLISALFMASCTTKQETPQVTSCTSNYLLKPDSIVYGLNLLSNIMFGVDTTYNLLQGYAEQAIHQVLQNDSVQAYLGEWSVAWGPVVFSNSKDTCADKCVVDNLLVLYKRQCVMPGVPEYVLATSGTNDISKFGWFSEDFDAYQMVPWPSKTQASTIDDFAAQLNVAGSTSTAGITVSLGTAAGLFELLDMTDGNQGKLYEALRDTLGDTSTATIAVVGHSLGGALSPALALALKQYQSEWNSGMKAIVSTHPTAGASPGNLAFRDYFFQTIGAKNFRGRMNRNDLVPHGWQTSFLDSIKVLYAGKQGINNVPMIDSLVSKVKHKLQRTYGQNPYASLYCIQDGCNPDAASTYSFKQLYYDTLKTEDYVAPKDYLHFCCQYGRIKGKDSTLFRECHTIYANRDIYNQIQTELQCTGDEECHKIGISLLFLIQAGYQHTTAYTKQFNVEVVADQMKAAKKNLGISKTITPADQQAALLQALLNYIKALE